MVKGAYTWLKAINWTDDDAWAGLKLERSQYSAKESRAGRLQHTTDLPDVLYLRAASGPRKAVGQFRGVGEDPRWMANQRHLQLRFRPTLPVNHIRRFSEGRRSNADARPDRFCKETWPNRVWTLLRP
jgi:hypothetical protein